MNTRAARDSRYRPRSVGDSSGRDQERAFDYPGKPLKTRIDFRSEERLRFAAAGSQFRPRTIVNRGCETTIVGRCPAMVSAHRPGRPVAPTDLDCP